MSRKHAHCGYCGSPYTPEQTWPRLCAGCNEISYRNPLPVVVTVLPVDDGVLVIRRTIEPFLGSLALPGGYLDDGESWQAGCARELFEETGVVVPAGEIALFRAYSPEPPLGFVMIFGLAQPRRGLDLPAFTANNECSERVVIATSVELAFPTHTRVVTEYFEERT